VETKANGGSTVKIESGATKIVEVSQRDLYRKYRWPAEPEIKKRLDLFKETMEDD